MAKTTGEIRDLLANALEAAATGNLEVADGKNMIGLANQISKSMAVEITQQKLQTAIGRKASVFGKTKIG